MSHFFPTFPFRKEKVGCPPFLFSLFIFPSAILKKGNNGMGRWGEGVFDDDVARDYLVNIMLDYELFIDRAFTGEDLPKKFTKMNFFDIGESYIIPTLKIMHALYTSLNSDYLPNPETIMGWKNHYISKIKNDFGEHLKNCGIEEWFQNLRLPIIEATFDDLLQSSRELHNRVN